MRITNGNQTLEIDRIAAHYHFGWHKTVRFYFINEPEGVNPDGWRTALVDGDFIEIGSIQLSDYEPLFQADYRGRKMKSQPLPEGWSLCDN